MKKINKPWLITLLLTALLCSCGQRGALTLHGVSAPEEQTSSSIHNHDDADDLDD